MIAVAIAACLFGARGAWIASPASPALSAASTTPPAAEQPLPEGVSAEDLATIAAVCPTALDAMPDEWRRQLERPAPQPAEAHAQITGLRFAARGEVGTLLGPTLGTGLSAEPRVAQAPAPAAAAPREGELPDGWLVSPDAWYVPEDVVGVEPPTETPKQPPETSEQSSEESSNGAPDDKPTAPLADEPLEETPASATPDESPTTPLRIESPAPPAKVAPQPEAPAALLPDSEQPAHAPAPAFDSLKDEPSTTPWPADDALELGAPSVDEPVTPPAIETEPSVETPPPVPKPPVETPPVEPKRAPKPSTPPAVAGPKRPSPWRVPKLQTGDGADRAALPAPPSPGASALTDDSVTPIDGEGAPLQSEPAPPESLPTPATPRAPLFSPPPAAPRALPPAGQPFASPHGDRAKAAAEARAAAGGKSADESHAELFAKERYPSAASCAECHKSIYDDWSISNHAYAFVSPMFHRFEEKITQLSNGTIGYFCYRCHSPVGTAMATELGYTRATPYGELPLVAREGITCIACHRVNERFAKTNGERRIVPGDAYAPMYGGVGGSGVAEAIAKKDELKIKTSPEEKGPGIPQHLEGRFFDQITVAEACTSCHQVAVQPMVKLEVVWEQYRASPACKKGITCQECHMGRVPGVAGGYDYGAIAEINGKTVGEPRKLHSHVFYGPGYSIAHPGLFPMHPKAERWTTNEWIAFDWRAGWGTDDFEDAVDDGKVVVNFPKAWAESDDRCDAREIIDDNLKKLARKRRFREVVMENGSKIDGPFFCDPPAAGRDLRFDYVVTNLNEGHNLPTASLGAQPQLWANVVLVGPDGRRLWETGYTDSNGDLCDIHSVDVRKGLIPWDSQLFNLQTMFLITGATGTDREFYLPVNLDIDQVAQLRPGTIPVSVTNHPPFIRMESRSIAPLGKKRVKYRVPAELMTQPGRYRLSFRMRNRTEPMYFMRLCESTPEMHRAMVEGTLDIHPYTVEFDVPPAGAAPGAAAMQWESYPR